MIKTDTLAAEALQQLIGDPNDNGMPVILAKRYDPQIRPNQTQTLKDYGFEGLRQVTRAGKTTWEVYHDFVLTIDGVTGHCRIPDTDRNRKRLHRLSQGSSETIKKVVFDQVTGKLEEKEEVREILPTYRRVEQNLAQSMLVDSLAQKVLEMLKGQQAAGTDAPVAVSTNQFPTVLPEADRSPDLQPKQEAVPIKVKGKGGRPKRKLVPRKGSVPESQILYEAPAMDAPEPVSEE